MPYKINRQTGITEYMDSATGNTLTPVNAQQTAPQESGGFLRNSSNVLIPITSQFLQKAKAGLTLSVLTDQAEEDRKKREQMINQLITQSKKEGDPARRSNLLAQARDLSKQGSDEINSAINDFERDSGTKLNDKDRVMAEALGVAGELGTFLIPAGKLASIGKTGQRISRAGQISQATTATQRILKGAKLGTTVGAISGATDPNADTMGERFQNTLKEGGIGLLVGGATSAALEGTVKAAKSFIGTDKAHKNGLARLFRITPSKRASFRKSTGGMDFEAEILSRDAQSIAGMDHSEMVEHFTGRLRESNLNLDDILTNSKGTVSKQSFITSLKGKISELSPQKGNVGTSSARSQLEGIIQDLSQLPDDNMDLITANNIKKQLQSLGDAAFSPNSKPTVSSKAFANASTMVKDAIEKSAQTGDTNVVREANKTIQLYQAAKQAIETTGDREAVKISNDIAQKFMQVLPAAMGTVAGVGAGLSGGGVFGGIGAGALATMLIGGGIGAARVKYLSPQVQTSLIARFSGVLESQGMKNASVVAKQITAEISKHVARLATLTPGVDESQDTPQGVTSEFSPQLGDVMGGVSQQNQGQVPSQLQSEVNQQPNDNSPQQVHAENMPQTITIRNKKTGEIKQVQKTELSKYGFASDADDAISGLPSKGEILAAMVLDAQQGGKNISKLKTILDAYDQVNPSGKGGKVVPATQAGALGEFDSAISLMGEVETILKTQGDLFGPVKGTIGTANPYAVESQKVDSDLRRAAQIVGKAMEGGVLRKEDEIKYRRMLPNLSDKPEVAEYKMKQVKAMLERNRSQRVLALESAGYNPETDRISGANNNPEEF